MFTPKLEDARNSTNLECKGLTGLHLRNYSFDCKHSVPYIRNLLPHLRVEKFQLTQKETDEERTKEEEKDAQEIAL